MKSKTTGEQVEVETPLLNQRVQFACGISLGFNEDSQGFVKDLTLFI